jgi:hypothetical protein
VLAISPRAISLRYGVRIERKQALFFEQPKASMEPVKRTELSPVEIAEIIRGIDPIDWVQLRLTARLSPEERILAGLRAMEFAMAMLRGTFAERFPELSQSERNLKVLAYLTPVYIKAK